MEHSSAYVVEIVPDIRIYVQVGTGAEIQSSSHYSNHVPIGLYLPKEDTF